MRRSRVIRRVVVVAALIVGLAIGVVGGSIALAKNSDNPSASTSLAVTDYPKNAQGLTYGSDSYAKSPQDEPDLILATATNGKEGYVLRTDLEEPMPASPQEALKQQAARAGKDRVIPVYESDGITQIGVFTVGLGHGRVTLFTEDGEVIMQDGEASPSSPN